MASAMRTLLAMAALMAVLMGVGVAAAAVFLGPPEKDLFLPPPADVACPDAYRLRAAGTLAWLELEGGMWDFHAGDGMYDLYGVEDRLAGDRVAQLQAHPGTYLPAIVAGVVEPCLATFHMHGVVLRVSTITA